MRGDSRLGLMLASGRPADEALRTRVRALQRTLDRRLVRLEAGIDPAIVHQTRIATRRLRVVLRAFKKSFEPASGKAYRASLRALAHDLDPVRDADVALVQVSALTADESAVDAHSVDAARRTLAAERTRAVRALRGTIRGLRWRLRRIALRRAAEEAALVAAAPEPISALVERVLARERRRVRRAVRDVADDAKALHRLRLDVKAMRYLAEECLAQRRGPARTEIDALHELQDCLGELHDGWVLRERLAGLIGSGKARRALRDGVDRRSRRLRKVFLKRRRRLLGLWRPPREP